MQVFSFFTEPKSTPPSVRILIWILALTSLLSPLVTFALQYYFNISGPIEWLTLSKSGLLRGWLWQLFTYISIHAPSTAISLSFFISLAFSLFLLWFVSSSLVQRFGSRVFLLLYFSATLFAAVIASSLLVLFSSATLIAGGSPSLYALLTAWVLLYPNQELSFFFFIRFKSKALITLFLGLALLLDLSSGHFILFAADLSGIVWGWLMTTLFLLKKRPSSSKIIDISVMQESDEAFMERMLDKISERGEESLTRRERERMQKISSRKKF